MDNYTINNPDSFKVSNTSQIPHNPSQIPHNPSQIPHNPSQSLTNPHKSLTNPHKSLTNPHKSLTNSSQNTFFKNNENNFICVYCNKSFSRNDNLNRHINKYCKAKKKEDIKENHNTEETDIIKAQQERINLIEKEKEIMQKQIEVLLDKVGDTTNITTNQHIVLNCYGSEDLTHISNNFKMELLKIPYAMIPKLIKEVHFNQNYPQNNNIYLPNKKEPYVKIYEGQTWVYKDKKETIKELVEKNYNILDGYYEDNRHSLDNEENKRFITFQEKKVSNTLAKQLNKDVEMVLLDGR